MTDIDNKLLDEVMERESSSTAQAQKSTMNLSTVNILNLPRNQNGIKSRVRHKKTKVEPTFE